MTSLTVSMMAFIAGVKDRFTSEKGATATEYGLLIAFVAFAIIAGAVIFGESLAGWFEDLGDEVSGWDVAPAVPAT